MATRRGLVALAEWLLELPLRSLLRLVVGRWTVIQTFGCSARRGTDSPTTLRTSTSTFPKEPKDVAASGSPDRRHFGIDSVLPASKPRNAGRAGDRCLRARQLVRDLGIRFRHQPLVRRRRESAQRMARRPAEENRLRHPKRAIAPRLFRAAADEGCLPGRDAPARLLARTFRSTSPNGA